MKENGVGGENLKKICEFIVSGIECNIYFLCGHKSNMHLQVGQEIAIIQIFALL